MARVDRPRGAEATLRSLLDRAWTSLRPPPTPDYTAAPVLDVREAWLLRLARIRDALEQARTMIAEHGFTSGAWFTVHSAPGVTRPATTAEAFRLRDPGSSVVNACLVGTLVRLADDPDRVPSVSDVWGCVDELYEAMHEQMGHTSLPAGRIYPHAERRTRLRGLTAWNDTPGRTQAQVLDLFDRAISRTIVAACQ